MESKELSENAVLHDDAEGKLVGIDTDHAENKANLTKFTLSRLPGIAETDAADPSAQADVKNMSENSNHVRRTLAAVVRGALAPMQLLRIGSALLIAATYGHGSQDATSSASYALPNELVLRIAVTHHVGHEGDSLTIVATLANVGDSTRRHRSATTCHFHILLTTESGSPLPAAWHSRGDAITGLILPPGDSTVERLSLRAGRQSDFMAHRIGPGQYLAYASVDGTPGRAGPVRVTVIQGVPHK